MEEYTEEENTERRRRMNSLAENLLKKRAEAVEYRANSGAERRWREDEIIFDGLDGAGPNEMIDYATGEAYRKATQEPRRSKVVVNIIRGRCETAEGRFSDIQLPTDDRNWGLKVTPVPELSDRIKDKRKAMQDGLPVLDGQGIKKSIGDIAKHEKDLAKKAMSLMEMEIDDQLNECDYNGESRKMIRQAVRLGTGILKGPSIVKATKKSWIKHENPETGVAVRVLKIEETLQPESYWVDCRNVYPSPGTKENVQKTAEYIWEKDEILPRDIRRLMGVDGYDEELLLEILQEEPVRLSAAFDDKKSRHHATTSRIRQGGAYEKWEYHGDVNREDLEAMGCDCSDVGGQAISACVVFINDKPVKAELNTLDTGDLPYDFFQWTVISSDEPWGIGIPRMMIWLQRIITAAWREMMNNAGDSSGANIVMNKSVQPVDGRWEVGGRKLWISTGDIEDARQAFAQFQLANNQSDLQNIIELALRFVDLETSMPTIFQGEAQEVPETLGATNIMVDSANTGVRQRVKLYDDRITRPHITRYYHHNMQYNDKEEIKGDFNVDARGVSVLLEKDQQAQTLLQVFSLKGDPDINIITDWKKAAKQFYASRRLDILKSDEEIEQAEQQQQQTQPEDPAIAVAKLRGELEMQKEQFRQQSAMTEMEFKAAEAERERQHEAMMKDAELQIQMMKYSMDKDIALDKLKVQLAISGESLNLQRDLSDKKATAEVLTPPTEPAGRAPAGQSFQR